jgi:hypothetical protein
MVLNANYSKGTFSCGTQIKAMPSTKCQQNAPKDLQDKHRGSGRPVTEVAVKINQYN